MASDAEPIARVLLANKQSRKGTRAGEGSAAGTIGALWWTIIATQLEAMARVSPSGDGQQRQREAGVPCSSLPMLKSDATPLSCAAAGPPKSTVLPLPIPIPIPTFGERVVMHPIKHFGMT